MKKIIITKNISQYKYNLEGNNICVFSDFYKNDLPQINNCVYVSFNELKENYKNIDYFHNKNNCVYVGLNKIFTTSSRIHPIFDLLQYKLKLNKYSIDYGLYVNHLWGIWTHLNFTDINFYGYTYSYLLESHYNFYLKNFQTENPLSIDKLINSLLNNYLIDYNIFYNIEIKTIQLSKNIHKKYIEKKEFLFNKYKDINKIKNELVKFAKQNCKERHIPLINNLFYKQTKINKYLIIKTDLKIDNYLIHILNNKIKKYHYIISKLKEFE